MAWHDQLATIRDALGDAGIPGELRALEGATELQLPFEVAQLDMWRIHRLLVPEHDASMLPAVIQVWHGPSASAGLDGLMPFGTCTQRASKLSPWLLLSEAVYTAGC
jgi:hypothetical protein